MRSLWKWFVCLLLPLQAFGHEVAPPAQEYNTIEEIDEQIARRQELQDKYRASAQRNTNNAMRWQFQNENYLDARKAWDQVAKDKQNIEELQGQIDELEKRKKQLSK